MTTENARKMANFLKANIIAMTSTMLFLKVHTFDIVFHNHENFIIQGKPLYVNALLFICPILPSCVP